jgi:DNA-binding MarR family transcriptional regulator
MPKLSVLKTENCACFNVRKTARVLTQEYDQFITPSGLKTTQFTALAVIDRLGPIMITDLAKAMEIERTSLTRNLKLIEKNGFIKTRPGEDARSRIVELTEAGGEKLEEAQVLWKNIQSRIVKNFGEERFAFLRDELAALRSAVQSIK